MTTQPAIIHVDRPLPGWWYLPGVPMPNVAVDQVVAACRECGVGFYLEWTGELLNAANLEPTAKEEV